MLGYIHEDYAEDYGDDYSDLEGGILDTIKSATTKLWNFFQPKIVVTPGGTSQTFQPQAQQPIIIQQPSAPAIPSWAVYGALALATVVLLPKIMKKLR